MEVARGRLLWMLMSPAPKPMAGGPKKCWDWVTVTLSADSTSTSIMISL